MADGYSPIWGMTDLAGLLLYQNQYAGKVVFVGLLTFVTPMAVIFAKRDWEHAVSAHYMINMIPTLMVFLET